MERKKDRKKGKKIKERASGKKGGVMPKLRPADYIPYFSLALDHLVSTSIDAYDAIITAHHSYLFTLIGNEV